ncbi:putative aconitase [Methanohalophilus levihalophilus]|uniref:aconitase X n=1 Tax=Methanohalophilus levihalophilus TaxID=1431282 RepID=UPI001AE1226E|nr:aconitase X catalytic domain-containing protein [Methanohalophilus levihalophilus]MBP2030763.1 putative aconitase [Methanohalophilus levihalophilus]
MYLTAEEECILEGEEGETLRKAMEILVALGDIYGADGLIPIKSAQIAGVSYKTIGDAGLEWISDLKGQVKVPSVLNPAGMDMVRWDEMGISEEFAKKQKQIVEAYGSLGINTMCTCTPYYLEGFSVGYGDHLAWSESSAVSYANSVIGARTNREGGPSALSAALVGKTANYGYHLDENRIPNVGIRVECELHGADYGALGYVAGKISGNRVPIFSLTSVPTKDELKSLGAAMAASGAVALYHIENVTLEAQKMNYEFPEEVSVVERSDIEEVYATVGGSDSNSECDIAAVGCPHCSPEELQSIADMVAGKTLEKEFWVFTSREIAEKYPDLVETIEKSGAKVLCDTCMVVSPAANNFQHMAVNSGKAYNYVPGMCRINSTLCSVENCIKKVVSDDN